MPLGEYTLHIVRAADVEAIPPLDGVNGKRLERWFADATDSRLQLTIRHHNQDTDGAITNIKTDACDGAVLQELLRRILPVPHGGPIADIALLFCRRWSSSPSLRLYGLMFDYNGQDPDLGSLSSSNGIAREGCSVFLDAFDSSAFREMMFTAIHELGHVFNLFHDLNDNSFMAKDN